MDAIGIENTGLRLDDYRRYGRQMIIDGFGLPAQLKLQAASVIVVGAGGLGCPALQYLCAAGIGRIGIVDPDIVELSNLQRQILHSEATLGMLKVDSAAQSLGRLNAYTRIETHAISISSLNAVSILSGYDVILDCTDNAPTRYLLSDTAVRLGVPLVSGAAQRLEGQLCTYNLSLSESTDGADPERRTQKRGPCYRCLFPRPPAPELVGSCAETGILGAVTGTIGSIQALEAIKIIAGLGDHRPSLLIYSAVSFPYFRHITLRRPRKTCAACGDLERSKSNLPIDYVAFCGGVQADWVQTGLEVKSGNLYRIYAKELRRQLERDQASVRILDVRSSVEFGICRIPGSISAPLQEIVANPAAYISPSLATSSTNDKTLTVIVCRLGNDSQIAANALRECQSILETEASASASSCVEEISKLHKVVDLIGGLRKWTEDVDPSFPVY